MSDFSLTAKSPYDGYQLHLDDMSVEEVQDLALVSVAVPLAGRERLEVEFRRSLGIEIPSCGASTTSGDGNLHLLGLQSDQMFAVIKYQGNDAVGVVSRVLGDAGYYSDQSDSWAALRISGPQVTAALERICPLDLHRDEFPLNAVARTVMEHLSVIILRDGTNSYLLMSPRSSAGSFLHAVRTSINYVSVNDQAHITE